MASTRTAKTSRRQIEAMDYGTTDQMAEADRWYGRFARWQAGREDRYLIDEARRRLLLKDVWYLANRRFLAEQVS